MIRHITYTVCADPETPGQWLALRLIAYPRPVVHNDVRRRRPAIPPLQTLLGSCNAQAYAQDLCRQDAANLRQYVYARDPETTVEAEPKVL